METIKKKVLSSIYDKIVSGEKTYELRLADWSCKSGDILILIEMDDETKKPTGRQMKKIVGHVGKTKDFNLWTPEEVEQHGYQVISLLNEVPAIRIKDAWLLEQEVDKHLNQSQDKDKEQEIISDATIKEKIEAYRAAWLPYENQILQHMTEVVNLSFRQNIIDVYIAPYFNAFSDPLVVGIRFEPDLFVDILTHELLHRLLTDNLSMPSGYRIGGVWRELFGQNHTAVTLNHIPVHAIHKAIYLDSLKAPQRLQRDITRCQTHGTTDYVKAWEYVEEAGYQEIIEQLKKSYNSKLPT